MKKAFSNLCISISVSVIISVYKYYLDKKDCLGCGIAPDDMANLGPQFTDYLLFIGILIIPIFLIVWALRVIFNLWKAKNQKEIKK